MKLPRLPKLYRIGVRFPKTVLLACALFTAISFFGSSKLRIQSDLTALLPQNTESVQALLALKRDFGGASYLYLTVASNRSDLNSRFADEFVRRIEQNPSVLYVDYRRPVDFFKKRFWFYLDLADLHEIESRVDRSLELQKKNVSPIFTDFMDFADPEDRPNLNFADIFEKYKKRAGTDLSAVTSDDDGRLIVLRVKAKAQSEDIDASRKLVSDIRSIERSILSDPQYEAIRVGYTGNYETKIEAVDEIKKEIGWVSGIVAIVLLFILIAYFRSFWISILILVPLAASLFWTGQIVYLLVGHLNVVTGFNTAILAGLGSDYGIYLLTRYYQERKRGIDFKTACDLAFSNTGSATYGSMITTVGSFLALLFSKFGVFVEFGIVGAVGVVSTYFAMMLVIPSALAFHERHAGVLPFSKKGFIPIFGKGRGFSESRLFEVLFSPKKARLGILLTLILCAAAAFSLPSQTKIYFEDGSMAGETLPGNKLYDRVSQIESGSLNPTILLTSRSHEERLLRRVEGILKDTGAPDKVFNKVVGLSTFIPQDVFQKKILLSRIKSKAETLQLMLKDQKKMFLQSLNDSLLSEPATPETLPIEIRRLFLSPYNAGTSAIYLFPAFARTSSEAMRLYHQGVIDLKKKVKLKFTATDGNFISDDTVSLIEREAPRGLVLVLIFLALVLFATMRPVTRSLLILIHLFGGLILLSGALWVFAIPLNILNISVISIILGTGIDSFIHFNQRYEESQNLRVALKTKIPSILVSNLTTIVGFGGLILTKSAGLRSIGWVAVIGLAIITALCVFIYPRCLDSRRTLR